MNKLLLPMAIAGFCWLFVITSAFASHQQGNDLTYTCLAPGIYRVDLRFFRDCSGIQAANTYMLAARSPGCNNGRTFVLTKVGNPIVGNLYCSSIPANCNASSPPNYEEFHYQATVALTPNEQTCSDWVFSINFTDGNRPNTANLSGAPGLYSEAFVKLGTGINNNSAKFNETNVPVPMVNENKPVTIAFTASDPDGDSLTYKLVNARSAANTLVSYNNYTIPAQDATIYNETDSTQYALIPATGNFSPRFPMHSYLVDWSGPNPHPVHKYFDLDSVTGKLTFTPAFYVPNATSVSGANKYNVAVQVNEFRKINGAVTKVGTVTREVLISLISVGSNHNPQVSEITVNNQVFTSPVPVINTNAGIPVTIQIATADPDIPNNLSIETNATDIMPGAVNIISNGNRPTATISWNPNSGNIRQQPYYFNVIVKDDACPAKGYHSETIGIRVHSAGAVTSLPKDVNTTNSLLAIPNPFSEEVSFKISSKSPVKYIVICNALGQEIDRISAGLLLNPEATIPWENAARFSAGTYFAKLIKTDRSINTIQFNKLQ